MPPLLLHVLRLLQVPEFGLRPRALPVPQQPMCAASAARAAPILPAAGVRCGGRPFLPLTLPTDADPKRSLCTSCIHVRSRSRKAIAGRSSHNVSLHAPAGAPGASWGSAPHAAARAAAQDGLWPRAVASGSSDLGFAHGTLSPSAYGPLGEDLAPALADGALTDPLPPRDRARVSTPGSLFPGTPPGLWPGERQQPGPLALSLPKRRHTVYAERADGGASSVSPALVSDLAAELCDLGVIPRGAGGAATLRSPNEVLAAALAAVRHSAAVRAADGASAAALAPRRWRAGVGVTSSGPPRRPAQTHDAPMLIGPLVLSCFHVSETQYRWARDMGGEGLRTSAVVEQPPSPWVPGSWLRRYAQLPAVLTDARGRIVGCNRSFITISHLRREDMAGWRLLQEWSDCADDATRTGAAVRRVLSQPAADGPVLAGMRGTESRPQCGKPDLWHSGTETRRGAEFGVFPRNRPVPSLVVRVMLGMMRLVPEQVAASPPPEASPARASATPRELLRMLGRADPRISRQLQQAAARHRAQEHPSSPFVDLLFLLARKDEYMRRVAAGESVGWMTPEHDPTTPPADGGDRERGRWQGQSTDPRASRAGPSPGPGPNGPEDILERIARDASYAAARALAEDFVRRHGPLFLATCAPAPLGSLIPAHEDRWRMLAFASSAMDRLRQAGFGGGTLAEPRPEGGASWQETTPGPSTAAACAEAAAAAAATTTGAGTGVGTTATHVDVSLSECL